MQTTYGYYVGEYGGDIIPEQDFKKAKKQAEAYIRHLTYARGDIFVEENEAVNDAVCAVAEVYYKYNAQQQTGTAPVKSENNDGYSVTYVTEQSDGNSGRGSKEESIRCSISISSSYRMAVEEGGDAV